MSTILLLEDDETFSRVLARSLERKSFDVIMASNIEEAKQAIQQGTFEYGIFDLKLAEGTSMAFIPSFKERFPESKVLILTGYASITTAVDAIKLGADNYLPKPADTNEILSALLKDEPNQQPSSKA